MQKIAIFGAGNCGRLIANEVLSQDGEIVCFVDNDKSKEGKSVEITGGGELASKRKFSPNPHFQC